MENVLKYYEFSEFFTDRSGTFSSPISFTVLNTQHFLIFEKKHTKYTLYVAKYDGVENIGEEKPKILELLVADYDKSNSEHRIILRKYLG